VQPDGQHVDWPERIYLRSKTVAAAPDQKGVGYYSLSHKKLLFHYDRDQQSHELIYFIITIDQNNIVGYYHNLRRPFARIILTTTLHYKQIITMPSSSSCQANEEWPQMTAPMPMSAYPQAHQQQRGHAQELSRPAKKRTEQINLKNLSASDLSSLKQNDPFMYYSIPGVRNAAQLGEEIDVTKLDASMMQRNCFSCPSRMQSQGQASSSTVTRCSRISFECHTDVIMGDLLSEMFDEMEGQDDDDAMGEVDFDMLLERYVKKQ